MSCSCHLPASLFYAVGAVAVELEVYPHSNCLSGACVDMCKLGSIQLALLSSINTAGPIWKLVPAR